MSEPRNDYCASLIVENINPLDELSDKTREIPIICDLVAAGKIDIIIEQTFMREYYTENFSLMHQEANDFIKRGQEVYPGMIFLPHAVYETKPTGNESIEELDAMNMASILELESGKPRLGLVRKNGVPKWIHVVGFKTIEKTKGNPSFSKIYTRKPGGMVLE